MGSEFQNSQFVQLEKIVAIDQNDTSSTVQYDIQGWNFKTVP